MVVGGITGWQIGNFYHTIVNPHIYVNHIPMLTEQIKREVYDAPRIEIDIFYENKVIKITDYTLFNYKAHPHIKMDVSV